ncbi:MAG: hypothetical protein MZW92_69870 [Comamonadaceae bacterium]|nr:hypothetical protein [Comamonadaceae bacterium]
MVAEFFRRDGWEVVGGVGGAVDDPGRARAQEWVDVVGFSHRQRTAAGRGCAARIEAVRAILAQSPHRRPVRRTRSSRCTRNGSRMSAPTPRHCDGREAPNVADRLLAAGACRRWPRLTRAGCPRDRPARPLSDIHRPRTDAARHHRPARSWRASTPRPPARLVGAASRYRAGARRRGHHPSTCCRQNAELGARRHASPGWAGPGLQTVTTESRPEGRGPAARRAVGRRRHRALAPGQPPACRTATTCRCCIRRCASATAPTRAPRAASSPSAATCAPWWRCSAGWSTRSRPWSATTGASARPRPATATCSRPRRRRCSSSTACTQKVLEANPVARKLCAGTRAKLVGATLSALFDAGHARTAAEPAGGRALGRAARTRIRARLAGGNDVTVSASVFQPGRSRLRAGAPDAGARERAGGKPACAAAPRMAAHGRRAGGRGHAARLHAELARRAGRSCDPAGKVLAANRAFLVAGPAQRRGAGARPGAGPLGRPHRHRTRRAHQPTCASAAPWACSSPACAANTAAAPRSRSRPCGAQRRRPHDDGLRAARYRAPAQAGRRHRRAGHAALGGAS